MSMISGMMGRNAAELFCVVLTKRDFMGYD